MGRDASQPLPKKKKKRRGDTWSCSIRWEALLSLDHLKIDASGQDESTTSSQILKFSLAPTHLHCGGGPAAPQSVSATPRRSRSALRSASLPHSGDVCGSNSQRRTRRSASPASALKGREGKVTPSLRPKVRRRTSASPSVTATPPHPQGRVPATQALCAMWHWFILELGSIQANAQGHIDGRFRVELLRLHGTLPYLSSMVLFEKRWALLGAPSTLPLASGSRPELSRSRLAGISALDLARAPWEGRWTAELHQCSLSLDEGRTQIGCDGAISVSMQTKPHASAPDGLVSGLTAYCSPVTACLGEQTLPLIHRIATSSLKLVQNTRKAFRAPVASSLPPHSTRRRPAVANHARMRFFAGGCKLYFEEIAVEAAYGRNRSVRLGLPNMSFSILQQRDWVPLEPSEATSTQERALRLQVQTPPLGSRSRPPRFPSLQRQSTLTLPCSPHLLRPTVTLRAGPLVRCARFKAREIRLTTQGSDALLVVALPEASMRAVCEHLPLVSCAIEYSHEQPFKIGSAFVAEMRDLIARYMNALKPRAAQEGQSSEPPTHSPADDGLQANEDNNGDEADEAAPGARRSPLRFEATIQGELSWAALPQTILDTLLGMIFKSTNITTAKTAETLYLHVMGPVLHCVNALLPTTFVKHPLAPSPLVPRRVSAMGGPDNHDAVRAAPPSLSKTPARALPSRVASPPPPRRPNGPPP